MSYLYIPPTASADTIVPIQEPTSSPSVAKTTINSEYKYMTFINTEPSLIALQV